MSCFFCSVLRTVILNVETWAECLPFSSTQGFKPNYLKISGINYPSFQLSTPGNILLEEWPEMCVTHVTDSPSILATRSMKCCQQNAHLHLQPWPIKEHETFILIVSIFCSCCQTPLSLICSPKHSSTPCSWGTSVGFCCH